MRLTLLSEILWSKLANMSRRLWLLSHGIRLLLHLKELGSMHSNIIMLPLPLLLIPCSISLLPTLPSAILPHPLFQRDILNLPWHQNRGSITLRKLRRCVKM